MTKERYKIVFLNGFNKLCSIQDTFARIPTFYNDLGYVGSVKPVCDLLNEKEERIKELEKEVLDLRAEVGRLNSKKQVEKPHWLKYKSSKGYTKKVNQDIRFDGGVE